MNTMVLCDIQHCMKNISIYWCQKINEKVDNLEITIILKKVVKTKKARKNKQWRDIKQEKKDKTYF